MRAAFLDRDGVINLDRAYVHKREDFEWVPGAVEALRILHEARFALVIVTNQSGIGRGYYTEDDFHKLNDWMTAELARAGAPVADVRFCPHHPVNAIDRYRCECTCRKPLPGMILDSAKALGIDLSRSILFGDKQRDCVSGLRAGLPECVLLGTDGKEVPAPVPEATRVERDLLTAVKSDWFREFAAG
ncbi:HAD family hydrolase [Sutterella sp.]|uniref:D-glycero-alpha-D-manno-heptose-1,7-bisphosphate 7-phosphatase n=1 Tax=Sutterella sp. TaxID=1981025 RepID=UPI0026DFA607|nr:HAD family hydrolase [Sutterella sp.]MDO5530660.1 HAD family hydrolase [Sutterella sp.]